MSGQVSTLSACAHAHTTRRPNGACWDGALHMRRRQRVGCSTQQCWRSGRYGEANRQELKLQLLDTCRGAIGVSTVLQTMPHTSL